GAAPSRERGVCVDCAVLGSMETLSWSLQGESVRLRVHAVNGPCFSASTPRRYRTAMSIADTGSPSLAAHGGVALSLVLSPAATERGDGSEGGDATGLA